MSSRKRGRPGQEVEEGSWSRYLVWMRGVIDLILALLLMIGARHKLEPFGRTVGIVRNVWP